MNVGGPVAAARTVRGAAARREADGFHRTRVPDPGADSLLHAVDAPYAVGACGAGPLILAWNGTAWTSETLPEFDPALHGAVLTAVSGDVAVGGAFDRLRLAEVPLLLRRGPTGWHDDGAPELGFPYVLTGVRDVWAVGHGFPGSGLPTSVVLRHDGAVWKPVDVPGRPAKLLAVTASGENLLAAGARDRDGVILHFDGRSWREWRTRTGPVTSLACWRGRAYAAAGDVLLHWTGRRWAQERAPLRVNAVAECRAGVQCAGADALAVFDGRRWSTEELPGTWLGTDPEWLVGAS
ncbi:hypothetical protein [Actinocorallia sp. A-T 12471]|uniref:hypothetical protein n=1 Tax=Actinocorallia sp. A-T 12471 TaxID=3089813 RepID=UPI0029CF740E|nr:hypothetical protein [Actinocorallia sp. A-T 12471]MDX6739316.1 hypothetical protein [Actinocorallia sp. A-T 12471]